MGVSKEKKERLLQALDELAQNKAFEMDNKNRQLKEIKKK